MFGVVIGGYWCRWCRINQQLVNARLTGSCVDDDGEAISDKRQKMVFKDLSSASTTLPHFVKHINFHLYHQKETLNISKQQNIAVIKYKIMAISHC